MGAIGWITKDGREISFEEARAIARKEGAFEKFPISTLVAMEETRNDGYWLSPSSATYCNRQRILKRENDYYQDLEGSWTSFTGTAYHGELARQRIPGLLYEQHLSIPLSVQLRDGTETAFTLQGTADLYDEDQRSLYDWKTIGDFQYYDASTKTRTNRVLPDPSHVLQINLYALMLRWKGFPVEHAYIWYVKSEGKKGVPRKLVEVELWEMEDTYHLACDLAEPLAFSEKCGILPQEQYDPTLYMCQSCPVQALCRELAGQGK